MPRTKHLVIAGILVFVVLLIVAFGIEVRSSGRSPVALFEGVTDVAQTANVYATVAPRDDREAVRERLVTALKDRAPVIEAPVEEEVVASTVQSGTDETIDVPRIGQMPARGSLYACLDDFSEYSGGRTMFGERVTVRAAEGARIIASQGSVGSVGTYAVPERTLQLPQYPSRGRVAECLPEGVVGIERNGMLIHAGESLFEHNATIGLIGYANDGFGIVGPIENGIRVTNSDLDECHGHTHALVWDGEIMDMYHYHVNDTFPYTIGCFRGSPVPVIE